jgi:hypothetical protein
MLLLKILTLQLTKALLQNAILFQNLSQIVDRFAKDDALVGLVVRLHQAVGYNRRKLLNAIIDLIPASSLNCNNALFFDQECESKRTCIMAFASSAALIVRQCSVRIRYGKY